MKVNKWGRSAERVVISTAGSVGWVANLWLPVSPTEMFTCSSSWFTTIGADNVAVWVGRSGSPFVEGLGSNRQVPRV